MIEKDAKQLSHVNWLQLGDNHIAFFGHEARTRRDANSPVKFTNEKEDAYLTLIEAKRMCTNYYERLFAQLQLNFVYC